MDERFNSAEYKRSRVSYVIQCTAEYFVSILVADAFLAKLLKYIGLSDSVIGIISSLVSFAFLVQLLSIPMACSMKKVKLNVIVYDSLSVLLFLFTYVIPLIPGLGKAVGVLAFFCISFGFFLKYLVLNIYFKWGNSFVSPDKRGSFSATKEMVSLLTGIGFTLFVGFITDRLEAAGKTRECFVFIAAVMAVLAVINLLAALFIANNDESVAPRVDHSMADVMKNTMGVPAFRNVVIMHMLFEIARFFSIGFMGTFKTQELLFTLGTIQVINMLGNLARFFLSRPFGRFSDRTSYARGYILGLLLYAMAFGVGIFVTGSTRWLIVVYTIGVNTAMAGINANSYNMTYSYVKDEYFVQALAIKSSIGGVAGFLASLLGGWILSRIQNAGNRFLGMAVYGQQVLNGLSFVLCILVLIYTIRVIDKQKVMKQ